MNLAKFFGKQAKSPFNGLKPLVIVDMGLEKSPTRGDMHVLLGQARCVAKKLDGEMLCLDEMILAEQYPDVDAGEIGFYTKDQAFFDHQARLRAFVADHGYPDILFSRLIDGKTSDILKKNGTGLHVASVGEKLCENISRPCSSPNLVTHHLTEEILSAEGEKFLQEYDALPRPFIGVLMADGIEPDSDSEKLAQICRNYAEATIFVCTSGRSWDDFYEAFMENLRSAADRHGLGDRLRVVGYHHKFQQDNYGPKAQYNMYTGLIDQADHIIVTGLSGSIVSETLATGKVPIVSKHEWYGDMADNGLVARFSDCNTDKPLEKRRIDPVNLTESLADFIIDRYRRNREMGSHRFLGKFRKDDPPGVVFQL